MPKININDLINTHGVVHVNHSEKNLSRLMTQGIKNTHEVCALKIDGKLIDLRDCVQGQELKIEAVFFNSPEGLEIIRHDLAHIMADAIERIYGKDNSIKFAIGPVIKDGFYYDFDINRELTGQDFECIEDQMNKIREARSKIEKYLVPRDIALKFFKDSDDVYKTDIIEGIPSSENITVYTCDNFIDLCRGPHHLLTKFPCAFKLNKISGAYWRGDSRNKMLTRIYGIAFNTKDEMKNYIKQIEEAAKRDHRKLGKELELFHLQPEAPGQVFWHANGFTIYNIIQEYMRVKQQRNGYVEVKTPLIANRVLWERSGHWEKFKENMFIVESKDSEDALCNLNESNESHNARQAEQNSAYAIKPMNCPLHVQIFNQKIYSYRDLPLRMAEFGCCHRHEPKGALHGIMRVWSFVQDDAHIFCTEDQITDEIINFCNFLKEVYADFGFNDIFVKLSDRPLDPDKRAGSDAVWDRAEDALEIGVKAAGLPFEINKGEGAFYGPKLEFVLRDAIGRDWQCGTIQVDFVLPERLDANYIDNTGKKVRPVMLHRAALGSFERFIGILIENYSGAFPFWLAPLQVVIINVTNNVDDYAKEVCAYLSGPSLQYKDKNGSNHSLRVKLDLTNEQLNYKMKKYSDQKVPLICIIGEKERAENTVSLRYFGSKATKSVQLNDMQNAINELVNML